MNVLSLFDGISCGQVALERAGIHIDNYFASEIDKHAIKVTQYHYPDTIQLGDVKGYETWELPQIDLLIGGSPCTSFSSSGLMLGFNDPRGQLFFNYVKCLQKFKPKYFLLENVNMKTGWLKIITEHVGVEPIMINSSLLSAQNRVRMYWTNIPNITQPADKGIKLSDILEDITLDNPGAIRGRYLNKASIIGRRLNSEGKRSDYDMKIPISQCLEVRDNNTDKSNCITSVQKDNVLTSLPPGRYPDAFKNKLPFRYYTTKEIHRLQTLDDDYCTIAGISASKTQTLVGNAWTVDIIAHILTHIK